jgi:CheY-like chemotaxis protein
MQSKKIILAIDDNVVQLRLFNEMLIPKYDLRVVKSAADALNFLNANSVDLILLDIEMPNVDGREFLKDIREIPSYIAKPIIIVSGNSGGDFLKWARNSSAADVLVKPVTAEMLVRTIEQALAEEA